jgi:hypothetical protein
MAGSDFAESGAEISSHILVSGLEGLRPDQYAELLTRLGDLGLRVSTLSSELAAAIGLLTAPPVEYINPSHLASRADWGDFMSETDPDDPSLKRQAEETWNNLARHSKHARTALSRPPEDMDREEIALMLRDGRMLSLSRALFVWHPFDDPELNVFALRQLLLAVKGTKNGQVFYDFTRGRKNIPGIAERRTTLLVKFVNKRFPEEEALPLPNEPNSLAA